MAFFTKGYHSPGSPPGTLIESAVTEAAALRIRLIDYTADEIIVRKKYSGCRVRPLFTAGTVTWMHVQGQLIEEALRELDAIFQLHSLALEDVLNTGQRPKVESFDDQLFIVMNMPMIKAELIDVQLASFFLSDTFLVSFCADDFAPFLLSSSACKTAVAVCVNGQSIFYCIACLMF